MEVAILVCKISEAARAKWADACLSPARPTAALWLKSRCQFAAPMAVFGQTMAPLKMKTETKQKIRVMIVEDHILIRMGLMTVSEIEPDISIVAQVEDGEDAVETFRKH